MTDNSLADATENKRGQRLVESHGSARSSGSTGPQSPQTRHASLNLNRFQGKQLFYRVHNPLSKKIKVGKEKKINMCSKLQPVCRQNNFCLKRWLFSPHFKLVFPSRVTYDLLD